MAAKELTRHDDIQMLRIMDMKENDHLSGAEIGARLGRSRGAILGLIHRQKKGDDDSCKCQKKINKDGGMPRRWWEK